MHVDHNKILGCLIGAAAADAMGAATEVRTQQQIKDYFGGWVTTFQKPPADTFGRCNDAGMCTDDFIQAKYIMDALLSHQRQVTDEVMRGLSVLRQFHRPDDPGGHEGAVQR